MRKQFFKMTAVSAALLLATAAIPSYSLDLSIGGSGSPVGVGGPTGPSVTATIGGGNNVATATVGVGGNTATVGVGTGGGPLASVNSTNNSTTGQVNLGDPLGGVGGIDTGGILGGGGLGGILGGGGGGGPLGGGTLPGATPAKVKAVLASTAGGGAGTAAVRARCRNILMNVQSYDNELITLCRMIARLR